MKIFIVCTRMTGGGAERVGVMLANGFAMKGNDVSIITDVYQKATYDIDNHVKVLPLHTKTKNKITKWLSSLYMIRHHVSNNRPDVIIGIMHTCSAFSKIACIGLDIPVVLTIHHALERIETYPLPFTERMIDTISPLFYNITTVLTKADKEYWAKRKNIVVMPNPSSFPQSTGTLHKENVLLAAGRISDWYYKGFDILIEAWGEIASKYPEWKLEIAGNGSKDNFDFLKEKAIDNGVVDRIEFLGYRTDMQNLYQKAAIYVLSSRSEGLPMVLIEAMSQGCACVATDFKGRTKEIITNDDEGILCNPEDVDALAKGMERLIIDDEYRNRLQQNAIKRSEYFRLDNIVGMWESLLSKLVRNKR
jgi:glycosyltransferase involved in cell wall biosynthesis